MKISILIHLEISFLILVLIINDITAHNRPSTDKPNLILFLADDLGYGDLSTYGHPSQEDGPIDSMARQGLKLTQVYAAASLCTPSRAAILTGESLEFFQVSYIIPIQSEQPFLQVSHMVLFHVNDAQHLYNQDSNSYRCGKTFYKMLNLQK